jgi:hypothetical protein
VTSYVFTAPYRFDIFVRNREREKMRDTKEREVEIRHGQCTK